MGKKKRFYVRQCRECGRSFKTRTSKRIVCKKRVCRLAARTQKPTLKETDARGLRKKKKRPSPSKAFYESRQWLELRYLVLKKYGRVCMCCRTDKGQMHVDHILPRSKYPELQLVESNLQVLCRACNLGKSSKHEDDWRV